MHKPLPIPPSVANQFKDWTATFEYSYSAETSTWRLHLGHKTCFLKVARLGWELSLVQECDRMYWASSGLPVPKVLDYGKGEEVEWLLTEALPGVVAVRYEAMKDPASFGIEADPERTRYFRLLYDLTS